MQIGCCSGCDDEVTTAQIMPKNSLNTTRTTSVSVLQTNQSDPAISPLSNNNKNQFKNETMAPSHGKQKGQLDNSDKINSQQKFDSSQKLVDISKISEPGQSRTKKQNIPDTLTPGVHRFLQHSISILKDNKSQKHHESLLPKNTDYLESSKNLPVKTFKSQPQIYNFSSKNNSRPTSPEPPKTDPGPPTDTISHLFCFYTSGLSDMRSCLTHRTGTWPYGVLLGFFLRYGKYRFSRF